MNFEIEVPPKCKLAESNQNMLRLWNHKLGHVNRRAVVNTFKLLAERDFTVGKPSEFFCEPCVTGKQARKLHLTVKVLNNFKPVDQILTDVCGANIIECLRCSCYFLLFKDECTNLRKVYVFECSKSFSKICYNANGKQTLSSKMG